MQQAKCMPWREEMSIQITNHISNVGLISNLSWWRAQRSSFCTALLSRGATDMLSKPVGTDMILLLAVSTSPTLLFFRCSESSATTNYYSCHHKALLTQCFKSNKTIQPMIQVHLGEGWECHINLLNSWSTFIMKFPYNVSMYVVVLRMWFLNQVIINDTNNRRSTTYNRFVVFWLAFLTNYHSLSSRWLLNEIFKHKGRKKWKEERRKGGMSLAFYCLFFHISIAFDLSMLLGTSNFNPMIPWVST